MGNDILGWVPNGHPKREQLLNTETVSAPIDLVSAIMLSAIFPGKNAVRKTHTLSMQLLEPDSTWVTIFLAGCQMVILNENSC